MSWDCMILFDALIMSINLTLVREIEMKQVVDGIETPNPFNAKVFFQINMRTKVIKVIKPFFHFLTTCDLHILDSQHACNHHVGSSF